VQSTHQLLTFAATAFVLIVVPGPSVLFVVSRSVTLGRRAGLATVAGNAIGAYAQVLAVAIGVGNVVQRSIAVFTLIKVVGAIYLVWLGVRAFRRRRSLAATLAATNIRSEHRRLLREAFIVGATNPKTIVFFVAILPQFVDRSAGRVPLQMALLGLIFIVIALMSDSTWALVAGSARRWLGGSEKRLAAVGGASGVVTIGLGVRLALLRAHD